ncbi:chitin deacetylase 5a [Plakobranchus ocellatus]|uniref:Chitin deacetylase 5a n=1 Tax=Plakobranchus ocellatus TaxID=259542 RepID=A0AAV3YMZ2_9GAST|nr:chitin deacetylase 5a [Plakobranchus ocellatus]
MVRRMNGQIMKQNELLEFVLLVFVLPAQTSETCDSSSFCYSTIGDAKLIFYKTLDTILQVCAAEIRRGIELIMLQLTAASAPTSAASLRERYTRLVIVAMLVIPGLVVNAQTHHASCNRHSCQPPDCRCPAHSIPGNLKVDTVPQMVLIAFDDAVNWDNWNYYLRCVDANGNRTAVVLLAKLVEKHLSAVNMCSTSFLRQGVYCCFVLNITS